MNAALLTLAILGFLMTRRQTATPSGDGTKPTNVTGTPGASAARGIRNNNPGNIRASAIIWSGQTGIDTARGGPFAVFGDAVSGIRAMAVLLKNYKRLHGINTVRGIVSRYAPTSDNNNVDAYAASVERHSGLTGQIDLGSDATLARLIPAMIRHENGSQPYSAATINRGIARA